MKELSLSLIHAMITYISNDKNQEKKIPLSYKGAHSQFAYVDQAKVEQRNIKMFGQYKHIVRNTSNMHSIKDMGLSLVMIDEARFLC